MRSSSGTAKLIRALESRCDEGLPYLLAASEVVIVLDALSGGVAQTATVTQADVIIVAGRLRGLNALKDNYGQIQHEKVRKALEASSLSSTPAQAAGDQRQDTRKKLAR